MALRRAHVSLGVGLAVSVATVSLETGVCWLFLDHAHRDIVMVYLLGVVLLAVRFGYVGSLPATVLSVFAFDFFFTAPYLSFRVDDKRLILTFVLMAFVAWVISNQTERIRRREMRTAKLYAMSRELSVARTAEDMANVACRHLRDVFASDVWILLLSGSDDMRRLGTEQGSPSLNSNILAEASEMMSRGTAVLSSGASFARTERLLPLRASAGPVGVLVVRPPSDQRLEKAADRELLETFASLIALALERARLGEESQRAQLEVQNERLRNALLSSVSHDLRTPLAVIKGAVTAIIEQGSELTPARRLEHLETISEETTRLNRLLRNLLAMTSLEAGTMRARKEWQPLEEVVGVALNRLEEQLERRPVTVRISEDASLVAFDPTLLEQVFINLVENATKYTPASSSIQITARRTEDGVEVEVADQGPGVPEGQKEAIFEKFHRAAKRAPGMGLGLTISRGIIVAHGGRIWCENREGGGAAFRFTLPPGEAAPSMTPLPEAVAEP